jgi:hypothetical protein
MRANTVPAGRCLQRVHRRARGPNDVPGLSWWARRVFTCACGEVQALRVAGSWFHQRGACSVYKEENVKIVWHDPR